jgi:hypothetical protein
MSRLRIMSVEPSTRMCWVPIWKGGGSQSSRERRSRSSRTRCLWRCDMDGCGSPSSLMKGPGWLVGGLFFYIYFAGSANGN